MGHDLFGLVAVCLMDICLICRFDCCLWLPDWLVFGCFDCSSRLRWFVLWVVFAAVDCVVVGV